MPKKPKIRPNQLQEELKTLLLRGPATAAELCRSLQISQPVFSRFARGPLKDALMVIGQARSTKYALNREIPGVGRDIPLYRIDEKGKAGLAGTLHAIRPQGFALRGKHEKEFQDVPWFLEDLRPSGFLGRLVPQQHPELELPPDIRLWSGDQCLRYLTRHGWNLIGNWIVGEDAFRLYLSKQEANEKPVGLKERGKKYAEMAENVLMLGDAGSSAGGEQPKFLALKGPRALPVIVKFSPRGKSEISQRRADLLVCEKLALDELERQKFTVSRGEILREGEQTFLELERFDRVGTHGRRGLISLRALNLEFGGKHEGWSTVCRKLEQQSLILPEHRRKAEWLELFGQLIANSDMHLGNLSFFTSGLEVTGLAPVYDMLPMLYAPQNEQLVARKFSPPSPSPREATLWREAWPAAMRYWRCVADCKEVSPGFRKIAHENALKLAALEKQIALLPG